MGRGSSNVPRENASA
uniref:Uncharacterized protein n=1 Tax=Lepeophtheirus salmonis TaxID=72036 RepID=A0A0K2SZM9_LEPSM